MKILKLHFNNIQSLKGIHTIDFEAPPFDTAGLFAITGPTGAGKTTILDIITLALFNQVPRFGKLSNNSMDKDGSIMTQFTTEAFAEIEYEAGGSRYRSTWTIHRAKSGKLQDYSMRLAEISADKSQTSSTFLVENKSQVPTKNEEIIGLNYEQFVRSILLSQGEFAKFLKSDGKDRASLLEEITGTQIYREIGKAAFQKSKDQLVALSQLREKAIGVKSLSDDERDALTETEKSNKTSISLYFTEIRTRTELRAKLENFAKQELQLKDLHTQVENINEKLSSIAPKIDQLNRHKSLEPFYGSLKEIEFEEKRTQELHLEWQQKNAALEVAQLSLKKSIDDMSALIGKDVDEDSFMSLMQAFQLQVTTLVNQRVSLKESGIKYSNQYATLLDQFPIKEIKTEIQKIKDRKQQEDFLKSNIEALKNAAPVTVIDLEYIKSKVNKSISERTKWQDLLNVLIQVEALTAEIENDQKTITTLGLLIGQLSKDQEVTDNQIQNTKAEIEILSAKKAEQWRISNLEEQRNALKQNAPCPLCGSLDHPYVSHKIGNQILTLDKQMYDVNISLNKLIETRDHSLQKISASKGQMNTLSIQKMKNEEKIGTLSSTYADDQKKYKSSEIAVKINHIDLTIQNDELELKRMETLAYCLQVLPTLEDLNQVGYQYLLVEKELNELYKGQDVNKDADKIQTLFTTSNSNKGILTAATANLKTNLEKVRNSISTIHQNILPALQKLGYNDIIHAQKFLLDDITKNDIIASKKNLDDQKNDLTTTISFIENEIQTTKKTIDKSIDLSNLAKEINTYSDERDRIMRENGSITKQLEDDLANKAILGEIREQIRAKEIEVKPWITLNELIGDATGDKYARYAQNLSLKHLLQLANLRLAKLTDRYQLEITDIEIDLRVIDHYQGDITRSVKTLSGGESFIVSLALALSLSDMASKNVKLECLFIDEGFGTLDAETLETALETIEKLQSEGNRMIGIISHVESLKERITTQIRVEKSVQGFATIEVV